MLLTLSLVPSTRWQTLLNLDTVRQRNKPILPPEKPKVAPFFLGSSLTTGSRTSDSQPSDQSALTASETERSRISRLASHSSSQTTLSDLLAQERRASSSSSSSTELSPLVDHLTALAPSAADLEIRSLSLTEMPPFVRALTALLQRRRHFELVNTWMNVFLRVHGDFVSEVSELEDAVVEWRDIMEREEDRLSELVGYTKGVVEYLRSAR